MNFKTIASLIITATSSALALTPSITIESQPIITKAPCNITGQIFGLTYPLVKIRLANNNQWITATLNRTNDLLKWSVSNFTPNIGKNTIIAKANQGTNEVYTTNTLTFSPPQPPTITLEPRWLNQNKIVTNKPNIQFWTLSKTAVTNITATITTSGATTPLTIQQSDLRYTIIPILTIGNNTITITATSIEGIKATNIFQILFLPQKPTIILEPRFTLSNTVLSTVFSNNITITGSATDPTGIAKITGTLTANNITTPLVVNLDGTKFYANAILNIGTNYITITATNSAGTSTTVTGKVNYAQQTKVTVIINGPGSIKGITNNQTVKIGQTISATAICPTTSIFQNWQTSQGIITNLTFSCIATTNQTIIANFTTNYMMYAIGTYHGVFAPIDVTLPAEIETLTNSNQIIPPNNKEISNPATIGDIKITITKDFAFSLTLQNASQKFSATGKFPPVINDTTSILIPLAPSYNTVLTLSNFKDIQLTTYVNLTTSNKILTATANCYKTSSSIPQGTTYTAFIPLNSYNSETYNQQNFLVSATAISATTLNITAISPYGERTLTTTTVGNDQRSDTFISILSTNTGKANVGMYFGNYPTQPQLATLWYISQGKSNNPAFLMKGKHQLSKYSTPNQTNSFLALTNVPVNFYSMWTNPPIVRYLTINPDNTATLENQKIQFEPKTGILSGTLENKIGTLIQPNPKWSAILYQTTKFDGYTYYDIVGNCYTGTKIIPIFANFKVKTQ